MCLASGTTKARDFYELRFDPGYDFERFFGCRGQEDERTRNGSAAIADRKRAIENGPCKGEQMNKRELQREQRRQQKKAHVSYERLCAEQEAELRLKHQREKREREQAAEETDKDVAQLCVMSEIEPNRLASTLREEISNALLFARLLNIPEPIVKGTRARDLLARVFYDWRRQNSPLYNPMTGKFSQRCYSEGEATFEKAWTLLPGEDYDAELNPASFEPQPPPPESHNGGAAVPVPTAAEQLKTFLEQEAPVALFSSEIIPRSGSV
jgi:hypothetical protein